MPNKSSWLTHIREISGLGIQTQSFSSDAFITLVCLCQATFEEADVRFVEVKKASNEFDRDVAKVLREKKGAIMGAEKVIRYFEDRMRAKVRHKCNN